MFKNPVYVIAAALMAFIGLNAVAAFQVMFDAPFIQIVVVAIVLAVGSCVVVAAKDPTYKIGYWFGGVLAMAAIIAAVNMVVAREKPYYALAVAVLFPAGMWATYSFRKRRDIRRLQARFRNFGI